MNVVFINGECDKCLKRNIPIEHTFTNKDEDREYDVCKDCIIKMLNESFTLCEACHEPKTKLHEYYDYNICTYCIERCVRHGSKNYHLVLD